MSNVIFAAAYLGLTLGAFLAGKYIFPKSKPYFKDFMENLEKMDVMCKWADKFVVWAREFIKSDNGKEKMAAVVEQLKQVAANAGIEATEDQLKAIAQTAYEAMKAKDGDRKSGEAVASYYKVGQRAAAKGSTVNIYAGTTVMATDNVPDGALEDNQDGSVNVYNAEGEKVGEVLEELAEAAEQNATNIVIEDDNIN